MTVSALVLLMVLEPAGEGPEAQHVPHEPVAEQRMEQLEPPPHVGETIAKHGLLPPDLQEFVSDSVVATAKRWEPGSLLTVCFQGGSDELNARIAKVARQWNGNGNIRLVFGDERSPTRCRHGDNADIRVGYSYSGYWSVVGRDSRVIADRDHTTLNLEGFHVFPPNDAEFESTVLHEFGHALGLEHEHQSPNASCEGELEWDAVYAYFGRSPNYWSPSKVDTNFRPLLASSVDASDYDPKSVMHYPLPDVLFRDPSTAKCRVGTNTKLSAGDKKALKEAYPGPQIAANRLAAEVRILGEDIERAEGLKIGQEQTLHELEAVLENELAILKGQAQ